MQNVKPYNHHVQRDCHQVDLCPHWFSVISTKLTPGPTVSQCTKLPFCNTQTCRMFPTATVLHILVLTWTGEKIITEFGSVK